MKKQPPEFTLTPTPTGMLNSATNRVERVPKWAMKVALESGLTRDEAIALMAKVSLSWDSLDLCASRLKQWEEAVLTDAWDRFEKENT